MKQTRNAMLPLLAGFFVMGFGDIIGTVMNQVKAECAAHADTIAWLMPVFAYVWFLLISIPTGVLAGRIGRQANNRRRVPHRGAAASATGRVRNGRHSGATSIPARALLLR